MHLNTTDSISNGELAVVCKKCESSQIEISKRGFSRSTMFRALANLIGFIIFMIIFLYIGLKLDVLVVKTMSGELDHSPAIATKTTIWILAIAALPISYLLGFLGSNQRVSSCKDCGHKSILQPSKTKK